MHKTQNLVLLVAFPSTRPPRRASVAYGSREAEALRVRKAGSQGSVVRYAVKAPQLGRYVIQWTWQPSRWFGVPEVKVEHE